MKQLSNLDASMLLTEDDRNHGHICSLAILDPTTAPGGRFDADTLRAVIAQRMHLLPMFRWRLAEVPLNLDRPYWVDDADVDLAFHIRETAVPPPGDDHRLADAVARLHAYPLDRRRPLWEIHVIEGLANRRVAILTKLHHAAIDGVSGMELMSAILDTSAEGRDVERAGPQRLGRSPGQLELLGRGLGGLAARPWRMLRAAPRVAPHLDQLMTFRTIPGTRQLSAAAARAMTHDGGILERPRLDAPHTRFNERISAHRRYAFTTMPLDRIKALKNACGVTVNDVVLAIAAGALRRRLSVAGELPASPLLAMVPVSVRTAADRGEFGMRVSTMVVALPTNEADAATRMDRLHTATRSAKERHRAMPATAMQDSFELLPMTLLTRASRVIAGFGISSPLRAPANVAISNVPGARVPLYCAGARLEGVFPVSMIIDSVALNITVISYEDDLDIGIVGDRELVPDVWELCADMHAELDELEACLPAGAGAELR